MEIVLHATMVGKDVMDAYKYLTMKILIQKKELPCFVPTIISHHKVGVIYVILNGGIKLIKIFIIYY